MASHGNLTKSSIERRSQSFGILKDVQESLEITLLGDEIPSRHAKDYQKWREDLQEATGILLQNNVFKFGGKRCHNGFEGFNYSHVYISDIKEYTNSIHKLSSSFDNCNRLAEFVFEAPKML